MSVKQVTRDQHYVQRKYLSLWTDDLTTKGFVNAQIDGRPFKPINIKHILFEKDFYGIPILNDYEIQMLYICFKNLPTFGKNDAQEYIKTLINVKELNEILNNEQRKKLRLDLIQYGEDIQSAIENMMDEKLRNMILNCDDSFLDDELTKQKFLTFLFMQYFRTPKVREKIVGNIDNYLHNSIFKNINGNKYWAVMNSVYSISAANHMMTKNVKIKFLKTREDLFLTSDCPVVRLELAKDKTDRFYYPFSPEVAMIIGTNDSDCGIIEINKDEVEGFNYLMRKNSCRIVISKYNHTQLV